MDEFPQQLQPSQQPSPVIVLLKKIWPFIDRVIRVTFYYIFMLIKNFFRDVVDMIKGGY